MRLSVGMALEGISMSSKRIKALESALAQERAIRNNLIVDAIDNKVASRELQRRTGLSRQQIVNIGARGPQGIPPAPHVTVDFDLTDPVE